MADITFKGGGESISEGTISRWLKKDGDVVQADQPVCEVETEKVNSEIPAPAAGTLRITAKEGQTISVGAVIGRVEESAAVTNHSAPAPAPAQPAPTQPAAPVAAPAPTAGPGAGPDLSPAARRLAEEAGLELATLPAGKGALTKEDIQAIIDKRKAAPPAPPQPQAAPPAQEKAPEPKPAPNGSQGNSRPRETRQRLSSIRARIAQRLVEAQNTAAILTTFNEADMTAVMDLRAKYKESFQKKHGVGLGFMSFFVKASVEALKAFPVVNSQIDGNDMVTFNTYDISVAVSTEKGLMVPVIRDTDALSFAGIEKAIADVAKKARESKITPADLQGGTFTITNGGVFGSLLSTPILNSPQTAILGMHTIQKRPVAVDDQVVIRPMMYLALSYDHRLIDGREAVSFLVRIKECLEHPERMMLDI